MDQRQPDTAPDSPLSRSNLAPADNPWEAAYLRFETPEQEIRKFAGRLKKLGAMTWPRDSAVVELFSGRGNGLHALELLGFHNLEGVDLSPRLVAEYIGPARCYVADCRALPFESLSKDVLVVQGGLHHLPDLPGDLDRAFAEMKRVLRPLGRVVFVEPWLTPFLSCVHFISKDRLARRFSAKLDALATMIEHEIVTYEQWLSHPALVTEIARKHFHPVHESHCWGKWNFVGFPR
jgi:SAM-dependent methyltransferase